MELRKVFRPKVYREQNPPNRAGVSTPGPARFGNGKNKGRIIPTRPNPVKAVWCARCTLPFARGLQPAMLILGFDKEGTPIDQYVHRSCVSDVAEARKLLEKRRIEAIEQENRRRKTSYTRHGPSGFFKS